MNEIGSELQHFHEEHREILGFLARWEEALRLAASPDESERCRGLAQLREMGAMLDRINEHCVEEEQSSNSAFRLYIDDAARTRLRAEHDLLDQMTDAYLEELRYVTAPPPADRLVEVGRRLLGQLRQHVQFEEELLAEVEAEKDAEEKVFLRYTAPAE